MELRSNRSKSRSLTPFTQVESFNKEVVERGNHMEQTVTRSTRRTTVRLNENATSSTDEVTSFKVKPVRRSSRSERNLRKLYKTSDYSSEDGENEVTSTRMLTQNEKNQLIEDARAAANGTNEVSALELYKKSGRYWDIYPKTDWTYSQHSKDRVELAPGVVAMPNMSRKSIHSVHGSETTDSYTDYANKETNTESFSSQTTMTVNSSFTDVRNRFEPKQLFNNNYENYDYRKETVTRWTSFKRTVASIFTTIFTVFYYFYEAQIYCFSKLHKFTSRVMLLDTWLLWKTGAENKAGRLVMLCLLPLILLGGLWFLSSWGNVLYGTNFNSSSSQSEIAQKIVMPQILENTDEKPKIAQDEIEIKTMTNFKPPNAEEIAASLSPQQIEAISNSLKDSINVNEKFDTEEIVQKIVDSPSFQNIVNNYKIIQNTGDISLDFKNNQKKIFEDLTDEIEGIKLEMLQQEKSKTEDLAKILAQLRAESSINTAKLTYQLNRCCRKPIINIESYVNRIVANLLNDPGFLKDQKGLNEYLHSSFVAKQNLEAELTNLTHKLGSKFDGLIEDNGRLIMEDISKKITLEIAQNNLPRVQNTNLNMESVGDDRVRDIVKQTLAIYDADKTGLVDYAMETMGGQILTTRCTENYHFGKAVVSVLGIPLWYPVNSPRTIITPTINPGECWAFQNFPGFVVLRLSNLIKVKAFSLEHISKLLVPNGKIDSAPKEFEVYGLHSEEDKEPVKLGEYIYNSNGDPLQFFPVQSEGKVFEIVEIRILSNHGNPNYTCLYRFRVHGKLSRQST